MKFSFNVKKFLSVLLVLSLIVALLCSTSCGLIDRFVDDDNDEESTTQENTTQADTTQEVPEEQDGKNGSEGRNEFIEGIGGVSETYTGTVSNQSYSSAQDAAEAFVAEEIAGESNVEIVNATSSGELSSQEITALNLPTSVQDGMIGVEKLEVEYSLSGEESLYANGIVELGDKLNKTTKVTVYVIKYENEWKYFTPMPVTGDTITKSYYDSVFNAEKYKNCTLNSTVTLTMDVSGSGDGEYIEMSMEISITQLIKHADNKVYLEQTVKMSEGEESSTTSVYAYMEEVDGEVVCYVKMDPTSDQWYETYLSAIGFSSLDELTPFYDQYLDYTYFTKTNYGFVLDKDNMAKYMEQALAGMDGMGGLPEGVDMDIDMFAEYYVSDGVLSGMRMDSDISMDMSDGGSHASVSEVMTSITTCTDYGTTVVERPFEE